VKMMCVLYLKNSLPLSPDNANGPLLDADDVLAPAKKGEPPLQAWSPFGLMLNGENDSLTPVQQAFLLQQRLTEVNHPDHTLITYPNLGHVFYPSPQWETRNGPIEPYVLADLYSWLEAILA
jgi:hypothetical protein